MKITVETHLRLVALLLLAFGTLNVYKTWQLYQWVVPHLAANNVRFPPITVETNGYPNSTMPYENGPILQPQDPRFIVSGPAQYMLPLLFIFFITMFMAGLSALIRRRIARLLVTGVCIVLLVCTPWGTALGIYGLIVMNDDQTQLLLR